MADTLDFSTPVPQILDARKVFRQGLAIEGCIAIRELNRLADCLIDPAGDVSAALSFGFDEQRRQVISGEVTTNVNVQCQRCLEPVAVELVESVNLALVRTEEMAKSLPASLDPWISEDEQIRPADIIEEQLILGLPIAATHDDCESAMPVAGDLEETGESGAEAQPSKPNPFAVLASLKDKKPDS